MQIRVQHLWLHSVQISTPARATSPGYHRPYGGILFQIPAGASPPLPKFPSYTPPISVWPHHTPQKPLDDAPHPPGCATMELWLSFPLPMITLGLAKTVIPLVWWRSHMRALGPQYGQFQVLDWCLHLQCWIHQHKITGLIWDTPPGYDTPL